MRKTRVKFTWCQRESLAELERTRTGEFLDQPRIAIEELASSVEFGCEMVPIHLETGFHPWRDGTGTKLTRGPLLDLNNPLKP